MHLERSTVEKLVEAEGIAYEQGFYFHLPRTISLTMRMFAGEQHIKDDSELFAELLLKAAAFFAGITVDLMTVPNLEPGCVTAQQAARVSKLYREAAAEVMT